VRQLIHLGDLDTARDVISKQADRAPGSPLDLLEAQVLRTGRLSEASLVLNEASQRAPEAANSKAVLELQYAPARLAERQGGVKRALALLAAARATMSEPAGQVMPELACTH
jgi:hypothetical protein